MVSFSTYPGVFVDLNLKINIIDKQERKEIMIETLEIPKLTLLTEEQTYFEYNGEVYTRIRANSNFGGGNFTLSNGEKYKDGDHVWVKVEPIVWLKHPFDDIMISEKEIIAGVRFDKTKGGYNGDFNTTELKWFLDNHLSKDILSLDKLKKDINKNNYIDDEIKTINNFIYLDKDGNTIKKKKIIVRAKRKSNN